MGFEGLLLSTGPARQPLLDLKQLAICVWRSGPSIPVAFPGWDRYPKIESPPKKDILNIIN